MKKEDLQAALEAISRSGIQVAGDLVLEKNVEYEVANVEDGGIGIQINNVPAPKAASNSKKNSGKKDSGDKPEKPRETMTFRRKGSVMEGHLTLLFNVLTEDEWIDGNEADFKALFSGKADEDCQLTWKGKYGKGTLVELFKQLVNATLVIVPDGFTLPAILEGHFKDTKGNWLTGLDKGNAANDKALPFIAECVKLLKADPRQLLDGSYDDEDFQSKYDPYDHQDLNIHKR